MTSSPSPEISATRGQGSLAGALLRCVRPKQWTKNALLFSGIFLNARFDDPDLWLAAFSGFAIFCMLSGSVYIINDLQDVEGDRLHPKKRLRPIAAREVTPRQAGIFCGILMVLAMAWAMTFGWAFAACAGLYWLLVLSYSLGLKHIVIVDVMSLAAGFVLRALAGIYVLQTVWSDIPITEWFLTCTMFLALFIALCKRRAEMVGMEQAAEMRRVLSDYTVPLLDQLIAMASTLTIMSYALYCMQKNPQLLVTLPFVMFGVMRFLWHVYRNDEGGAPEVLLYKDPAMLICVSVWAGLVATVMVH